MPIIGVNGCSFGSVLTTGDTDFTDEDLNSENSYLPANLPRGS
jgi:hypothetical protein